MELIPTPVERLDGRDRRFIVFCLLAIAAAAAVTAALYERAFPEASIEFRVPRGEARVLGEKFLAERGRQTATTARGTHFASRFGVDDEPKVYLERELGLERASKLYGRDAKVWRWDMRWFRSAQREEERVSITPLGELVSWDSVRKEEAPGATLSQAAAREKASAFLASRGLDPKTLVPIEAYPTKRPKRTDWTFVDERPGFRMKDATVRYRTTVVGDEVAGFRELVHVPETWERDYKALRSKNEAAGGAATFGLLVTVLAMLGVLVSRIVRKDVRWGLVAGFGITGFVLALLSGLNGLPLSLYEYDTASPLSSHVVSQVVLGLLGALATGAGIAVVVASAEPPYRERFPAHLSLSGVFSKQGVATKRFVRGVLLGYVLVAFFFAYQAVFYVVAAKLGAWSPAEIPYSDMLSTAFPWATVLLIGFLPAVSEEGISRMFSISFLDSLGAGRFLAVVIPAFIWGFGHAAYPNQPFYIRGIEVGCAGVLIGFLMLRYGVLPLLVWHFTVDALYTALILLRSHNGYYVVSGAIAAGILLIPLAVSIALAVRRGGFAPERGLTNGDAGTAPPIPPKPIAAESSPSVRALSPRVLAAAGAVALALTGSFLVPAKPAVPVRDRIGRARAREIATAFLRANSVETSRFLPVAYGGTGFADDAEVRDESPAETGRMPGFSPSDARYVVGKGGPEAYRRLGEAALPLNFWVVRFVEPGKKEEWKVLVEPRRGRVVGFLNPLEEKAPAGAAPSDARARERALSAAAALGYPAGYSVLEVGTNARPKRVDTTVAMEAKAAGIADSAPRLTAVFHGGRLSAFYPSIHVPESFLEKERGQSVGEWLILGLRIVAAGSLVGMAIVLFLRAVRKPEMRWRSLLRPMIPIAVVAGAALVNRFPVLLRVYPTEIPLPTFRFTVGLSLAIFWMLLVSGAAIALVLISGARPGWRRALTSQGGLTDALLRAAIAVAGFAGLERIFALVERSLPALYHPNPALPSELESAFPALTALSSGAFGLVAAAAAAAVVALASREASFSTASARVALAAAFVVALIPSSPRSPLDFGWRFSTSVLLAGWLAVSAFVLLRDHVAAWVIFGALAFGGAAALRLLVQPAPPDAAAGWIGLILVAAAAAALIRSPRREASITDAAVAPTPAPSGDVP
jgi:hypothetical protein